MITTSTADLLVKQGDTFAQLLTFTSNLLPLDLTGYLTAARLVLFPGDPGPSVADLTLTSIALNQVLLSLSDVQTLALPARNYWWDFEWVTPGGTRQTILEGTFTVRPQAGSYAE